jgi:formiminotetrahydrofolate cyclodeaminase
MTAAMASSLVAMVARGARDWDAGEATATRALELRDRLVALAQEDTDAGAGLVRLGSMAEAERAETLADAIRVPAAIADAATETAALAELAEAHGRPAMGPDATAARLLATAAARVAEEIVAANGG